IIASSSTTSTRHPTSLPFALTTHLVLFHAHSSGTRRLARKPPSPKSTFTLPPSPWLTSRSIKVSPKPCSGLFLFSAGPSRSTQSITSWDWLRVSTDHVTSSLPASTEREPYLAALVPSS